MRKTATAFQLLVRVTGIVQICLGMAFWAGIATSLVPVHAAVGLLLVLGLWALAFMGFRSGAHRGLAALAMGWGLIVPALGVTQEGILTGQLHVLIQVVHLAVGVAAIGLAENLATQIKQPDHAGTPA